jgi:ankyrin repeat protein
VAVLKLLLAHGAIIDVKDYILVTPLKLALLKGKKDREIAKILIENGADVSFKDNYTPLLPAACYGYAEIISCLLDKGANVNTRIIKPHGRTVLHYLALNINKLDKDTYAKTLSCFFAHGADLSIVDNDGKTASQLAREKGNNEMAEMLERYQQNLEQGNKWSLQ